MTDKKNQNATVLITGVAGFIGSNLAAALLELGYTIIGFDNMSQGDPLNLSEFEDNPSFSMVREDVRNFEAVADAASGCDVIVHLAAFKIPRYSDALDTLTINGHGSEAVAEAAKTHGIKLVAASTSDVYGKNADLPFSETSDLVMGEPGVKRWAYAISKMFEEQLLFAYHDRYGIDVVLLRFFGGYGPNQNLTWWGGPQSVFIDSALDGLPMTLHGDGQQTRSFTYVTDHVSAIIAAIERAEANNMVFNVGQVEEITIEGLAHLIWRLVRGDTDEPLVKFIPYSEFGKYEDVRRRVPNIARARDILGFVPRVAIEDGLRKTIEWQVRRRRQKQISTDDPVVS
jgi:UDP-glucose 4-epimerase